MRRGLSVLAGLTLVGAATSWATSGPASGESVGQIRGRLPRLTATAHATSSSSPAEPPWVTARREHDPAERPARQWAYIQQATDDGCRERLAKTQAVFQPLPDEHEPDAHGCGIPRGVLLTRGPTGVAYSPPLRIDCSLALRLTEIETILHEEAERMSSGTVRLVGTRGSYNCRGVVGRLRGWSGGISEHSFGNAIDVAHVVLEGGKRISVLHHYPLADRPEGRFLRGVVKRIWEEADMRALGPDFDRAHRDHLHLDGGSRWWRWR